MPEIPALLDLPFTTLVPIALGFLCYILAFSGRNGHHSSAHTVLITVVFAAIVRSAVSLFPPAVTPVAGLAIGAMLAFSAAAGWRWFLADWTKSLLRTLRLWSSDSQSTALQSVLATDKGRLTELCVWTNTGQAFMSEYLDRFKDLPKGHSWIGPDGSVALYVTAVLDPVTKEWVEEMPLDENWGARLTIIPANQVARIQARYR